MNKEFSKELRDLMISRREEFMKQGMGFFEAAVYATGSVLEPPTLHYTKKEIERHRIEYYDRKKRGVLGQQIIF